MPPGAGRGAAGSPQPPQPPQQLLEEPHDQAESYPEGEDFAEAELHGISPLKGALRPPSPLLYHNLRLGQCFIHRVSAALERLGNLGNGHAALVKRLGLSLVRG